VSILFTVWGERAKGPLLLSAAHPEAPDRQTADNDFSKNEILAKIKHNNTTTQHFGYNNQQWDKD